MATRSRPWIFLIGWIVVLPVAALWFAGAISFGVLAIVAGLTIVADAVWIFSHPDWRRHAFWARHPNVAGLASPPPLIPLPEKLWRDSNRFERTDAVAIGVFGAIFIVVGIVDLFGLA